MKIMSEIDPHFEEQYNCRARVPEHPAIFTGWARDAKTYREQHPPEVISYGPSDRQKMDLFHTDRGGPPLLFLHGGYWQARPLTKDTFSHLARGLNHLGVSVAIASHDVCPDIRIGHIVQQVRETCRLLAQVTGHNVVVSGHSAGGHLAACLLATEDDVIAALTLSGLFELWPLISTSMNGALRLDKAEARELSPILWTPPAGKTLDAWVGGDESEEFKRQSRDMEQKWGEAGVNTRCVEVPRANHFTIVDALTDPESDMCKRIKTLTETE